MRLSDSRLDKLDIAETYQYSLDRLVCLGTPKPSEDRFCKCLSNSSAVAKVTVAVSMPNPARNVSRVGDRLISNRQGAGRFEHTVILHLAKLLTAVATQPVVSEPVVDVASAYARVSRPFNQ